MIGESLGVAVRPSTAAPSVTDERIMFAVGRHCPCDHCGRRYADKVEGESKLEFLCGYCRPQFPKARVVER